MQLLAIYTDPVISIYKGQQLLHTHSWNQENVPSHQAGNHPEHGAAPRAGQHGFSSSGHSCNPKLAATALALGNTRLRGTWPPTKHSFKSPLQFDFPLSWLWAPNFLFKLQFNRIIHVRTAQSGPVGTNFLGLLSCRSQVCYTITGEGRGNCKRSLWRTQRDGDTDKLCGWK